MTESFAVKKYDCLYTTQIHQKNKSWQDGQLRHHHFNSKVFLMRSEDGGSLCETFIDAPRNAAGRRDKFPNHFELEGEIELDNKFLVDIGSVVWTGTTNVSEISKATRDAKSKSYDDARAWAVADEKNGSSTPLATKTTKTTSTLGPLVRESSSKYEGFGIPPPQSYFGGKRTSAAKPRSSASAIKTDPGSTAHRCMPYSRPSSDMKATSNANRLSDRSVALEASIAPPSADEISQANKFLGKPSRAASAGFKPPRPAGVKKE
ncbi:hypothetical protein OIO90_003608 [Microbotryomycetes sp. JL221]|nr:hypothetical protein OIO90_003608 [Microbotryomycetes sp. JL221]